MKCEMKYIGNDFKKDLKKQTVRGILATLFVSSSLGLSLGFIVSQTTISIILAVFILLFVISTWANAVERCKSLNKIDNNRTVK